MATILEFPKMESTSYHNLTRFVDMADNTDILNFYMGTLEFGREEGVYFPGEYESLLEQIRKKRIELAAPKQKAPQTVTAPGMYIYCPEMGETKPACQIEAQRSYYGKHYHISTPLTLKGRGITFERVKEAKNLSQYGQYQAGWNEYTVTYRAMELLKEKYSISMESLLD